MLMQAIALGGSVMAKTLLSVCVSTLAFLPLMDRPHRWSRHRRLYLFIVIALQTSPSCHMVGTLETLLTWKQRGCA